VKFLATDPAGAYMTGTANTLGDCIPIFSVLILSQKPLSRHNCVIAEWQLFVFKLCLPLRAIISFPFVLSSTVFSISLVIFTLLPSHLISSQLISSHPISHTCNFSPSFST
jgi:hypothetical protein